MKDQEFHELSEVGIEHSITVDILLAVAVKVERLAMLEHFRPIAGKEKVLKVHWQESVYYVGVVGKYTCSLVQCEMGSSGRDGSQATLTDAIDRWNPHAVIMLGIAFGADRKKQQFGDVLVSTQVIPYELQRVSEDGITPRSPVPPCGQVLLSRARAVNWASMISSRSKPRDPKFGPILTGEKLVDNLEFRQELISRHKTAIGGEMEGYGLYSAASRRRREWILIKAICDFAAKKNKIYQTRAAKNSAGFVNALLSSTGLERRHFELGEVQIGSRTQNEKLLNAATELSFDSMLMRIREANRERQWASEALMTSILKFQGGDTSSRELIEIQASCRAAKLEAWLNAYDDAASAFHSDLISHERFESTLLNEVLELFTTEGGHSDFLYPREASKYRELWRVFDSHSPVDTESPEEIFKVQVIEYTRPTLDFFHLNRNGVNSLQIIIHCGYESGIRAITKSERELVEASANEILGLRLAKVTKHREHAGIVWFTPSLKVESFYRARFDIRGSFSLIERRPEFGQSLRFDFLMARVANVLRFFELLQQKFSFQGNWFVSARVLHPRSWDKAKLDFVDCEGRIVVVESASAFEGSVEFSSDRDPGEDPRGTGQLACPPPNSVKQTRELLAHVAAQLTTRLQGEFSSHSDLVRSVGEMPEHQKKTLPTHSEH